MIDPDALLADLRRQVSKLETDLRERSGLPEFDPGLREEYDAARQASRTAATHETWLGGQVTQAAVAWVLGTVFVRFCEDNGLIEHPYLSGPGDAAGLAVDRQAAYFQRHPEKTDRDWIVAGIEDLSRSPVAAGLFDPAHNPMWRITPSHDAAKELLAFWRHRDESGAIVHDFVDPDLGTRFLGDLYQDLSEHAKKQYALLQTPEFVEEFILDLTLEPAVDEFGLAPENADGSRGLRLIDPTCGSGHFLLGAFHRLLDKWLDAAPGTDSWELISRSLSSVHGVDKNPFAVAIARFRLLVAALVAGGVSRLDQAPDFPIDVAVGDSLLHGRGAPGIQEDLLSQQEPHFYVTEDVADYARRCDILGVGSYHVVVGNPPYITVKDRQENENYRVYKSCSGKYALSVPFAERFFQLAIRGGYDERGAGHVGQITANSFMKREFGKKLIEEFFPTVDLTHVIDTSGAYIPGHGTPTVILAGRRRWPRQQTSIRAVLGVRGEPAAPDVPADGLVWQAITDQIDKPGSESEWLSVADYTRDQFGKHPWSLSGGGATELSAHLEGSSRKLSVYNTDIGMTVLTLEDDVYLVPEVLTRQRHVTDLCVTLAIGDEVRDFEIESATYVLMPCTWSGEPKPLTSEARRYIWPWRNNLRHRLYFAKRPEQRGMRWFDLGMYFHERHKTALSIVFAFVATHNHFVLDRGGKVFNRSAPVIKLPESSTEDDHLELLGVLNSSVACFWLKQVSYPKGGDPIGDSGARVSTEGWSDRYEFTGTKLEQFPLAAELPLEFGRELDSLAHQLAAVEPSAVCAEGAPTRERLDAARTEHARIRGRMIAEQEELDWEVYRLYGLLDTTEAAELRADQDSVPELELGERAFEIGLARKVAAGELETQWFTRHGATPVTEIPEDWPQAYRQVVQRRIDTIEKRRDIALIERPECKRRWQSEPWEKKERDALTTWLLDRCEERALWFAPDEYGGERPRPMTVNRLADRLRDDKDAVSVARLLAPHLDLDPDADLVDVLAEVTKAEHVPYLAALRYKDDGLAKRAQWERVWEQQREEDEKGEWLDIPVPPKYKSSDFQRTSYWSNRGKLDVPKERFVSYPHASPDGDDSLLLGWAGWDHREQAHALMTLVEERATRDGWGVEPLTPLLAGLAEVMPWVRQWHGEIDPAYGQSPAQAYAAYLEAQQQRHGLTADDLRTWRPPKTTRGRRQRRHSQEETA